MTRETLWRRVWTAVLALTWAGINVRALDESDLFWHAAFGREIARQHTRVFAEPFSFAAQTATSQEWLWDLGVYALTSRFGWVALSWLVILLAGLAAVAVASAAWELRRSDDERPLGAFILTTALVSPGILSRVRERPETAAMALLPLLLLFGHRLANARAPKPRVRAAVAACLVQLLFVQLHPSFVLGPVVIAVMAGPELALGSKHARKTALAVAGGFALAIATNLPALSAVFRHTGGYAVANVTDMQPPIWEYVNPTRVPFFPAYVALGVLAIAGMARARRVFVRPLLLALIGTAIALKAWRGIGPAAVLAIPLAMTSFAELFAGARDRTAAALVAALYLLARTTQWFDATSPGGLGITGLQPAAFPSAAAHALERAPAGTRALTTYAVGAPLGFWLDRRIATFVDSRTPLVFGDAAYGQARAVWHAPDSLARATERFRFDVAVVERELPICDQLEASSEWSVAMVEPDFAMFVRRAGPLGQMHSLTSFRACASDLSSRLRPNACSRPEAVEADLAAIAAAASSGFVRYLRAEVMTKCTEQSFDADAVVALLEPRSASLGFLAERDGLLAWVYAKANRIDTVRELVKPHLDGPWRIAHVDPMYPALRALTPSSATRDLFELAYDQREDASPGWLEAKLALACVADGDRPCVTLHALRAAGFGVVQVTPALCWLRAQGNEDAAGWIEALHQTCP